MTTPQLCLLFSSLLFAVGLGAVLSRSNAVFVLLGVELMLNAANVNFIVFDRLHSTATAGAGNGAVFALFSIAIAAAEAAVGFALVIATYRHVRDARLQNASRLKG